MAPVTRSQKAAIPDAMQHHKDGQEKGHLDENHELQPLGARDLNQNSIIPPVYTINLSRPPAERCTELVADFKDDIASLTALYDELPTDFGLPLKTMKRISRLFLRRLRSKEQTEELRGISKVTGVEMYLLVCFNTLLDVLMGCTSGAARVKDDDVTKMLHFRTLDWTMDPLRRVVVQLEYVYKPGGPVVARSITYAGYVGVLTGVRKDLSMSLNFRPYHEDDNSKFSNFRFRFNHLLILLGLRPSISAHLRDFLIGSNHGIRKNGTSRRSPLVSLAEIRRTFPSVPTTAAYLTFSDGNETIVLEKDTRTARTRSSTSFISVTNHDVCSRDGKKEELAALALPGIQDLVKDSGERRDCVEKKWQKAQRRFKYRNPNASDDDSYASKEDVVRWVISFPTTNEVTHYAAVMDPKAGEVVWVRRWLREPSRRLRCKMIAEFS